MRKAKYNEWHEARWMITHLASKVPYNKKLHARDRKLGIEEWVKMWVYIRRYKFK